jgi:mxaA protein
MRYPVIAATAGRALWCLTLAAPAASTCLAVGVGGESADKQALIALKQAVGVTVDQPRPFGYLVGDLVTQRILLQIDGHDVEPDAIPGTERFGIWLERRPAYIQIDSNSRKWLIVDYQVVNSPRALTTIALPRWELAVKPASRPLIVSAWPISVGPMSERTVFGQDGLQALRPDREAPLIATAPLRRWLTWSLVACLSSMVAWGSWVLWSDRRAARQLPFARAQREVRDLHDLDRLAWQSLHRAIDRTAGRAIQLGTLPALFQRAPYLEALRPQIEAFLRQSAARFFGDGADGEQVSVHELCRRLRLIEKRRVQ